MKKRGFCSILKIQIQIFTSFSTKKPENRDLQIFPHLLTSANSNFMRGTPSLRFHGSSLLKSGSKFESVRSLDSSRGSRPALTVGDLVEISRCEIQRD